MHFWLSKVSVKLADFDPFLTKIGHLRPIFDNETPKYVLSDRKSRAQSIKSDSEWKNEVFYEFLVKNPFFG